MRWSEERVESGVERRWEEIGCGFGAGRIHYPRCV